MSCAVRYFSILAAFALVAIASPARAGDVDRAREAFARGLDLAREQKWGEALDAFEVASAEKKHSLTAYNAAVAERALGRYTRARARFLTALADDQASGGVELAQSYRDEAKTFVGEIDALLVHVDVKLDPADGVLAVDGRPVKWASEERQVGYAGVSQPGPAEVVGRGGFELVMDPGAHVITVAKEGFDPLVSRVSYAPGARASLALSINEMPGKLSIDASQGRAVVRVDEVDVGVAPVVLERPSGSYRVAVHKAGYVTYAANVQLRPGQRTDLFAKLVEDPPLTKRWWFWGALGGVVLTGLATSVLIVYSNRDYDGGNQQWVAKPQ